MTADKQYLTQITADDLRELALVANLRAGFGLQKDVCGGAIVLCIPESAFKRMAYAFCRQAWPASCPALTEEQIDNISLRA